MITLQIISLIIIGVPFFILRVHLSNKLCEHEHLFSSSKNKSYWNFVRKTNSFFEKNVSNFQKLNFKKISARLSRQIGKLKGVYIRLWFQRDKTITAVIYFMRLLLEYFFDNLLGQMIMNTFSQWLFQQNFCQFFFKIQ